MTIKILADFHHEDLYHSLHLLFEKRLGFELYRQIGLEWYSEDFWQVYNAYPTACQYLGINLAQEWDDIKKKNAGMYCTIPNETAYTKEDGIYLIPDYIRNTIYKGITLQKFKNTKFDIILSSMPPHIERFNKLISLYQPGAKHIFQVGNNWDVSRFNVKNILSSSSMANPSSNQNYVKYHQEFDLNQFNYTECKNPTSVFNMMHYMSGESLSQFNDFKSNMPTWKWSANGGGNLDGPIATESIHQAFKDYGFLWHYKKEGDGFGYNSFNALASGRPIITRKSFFRRMTLDPFLIDGKTCVDLDKHNLTSAINLMNDMAKNHKELSLGIHNHFKSLVDYDLEEKKIRQFIDRLK